MGLILKFLSFFCCIFFSADGLTSSPARTEKKVVYVYYWADTIADETIEQFEKETGIKVVRSYYDSDEILETKLLTKSSLYDIVMPSAMPYYGRQVELELYLPLDRALLPNWKYLDPQILKLLETVDPGNKYGIPYSWGTTGFAYNPAIMEKFFPHIKLDTYQVILDPAIIGKLGRYGVGLLDQPQDLLEAFLAYLKIVPNYGDLTQIDTVKSLLKKIRPYIKFFTSNSEKMVSSLVNGEAAFVQMWSGEALRAQKLAKEVGKEIKFVIPKEHAGAWCDLMAIPRNAPHPHNAHRFINFMMRPEIAAKNMQNTLMTIANAKVKDFLPSSMKNNTIVFPPKEVLDHLKLNEKLPLPYERKTIRMWAHVKAKQ